MHGRFSFSLWKVSKSSFQRNDLRRPGKLHCSTFGSASVRKPSIYLNSFQVESHLMPATHWPNQSLISGFLPVCSESTLEQCIGLLMPFESGFDFILPIRAYIASRNSLITFPFLKLYWQTCVCQFAAYKINRFRIILITSILNFMKFLISIGSAYWVHWEMEKLLHSFNEKEQRARFLEIGFMRLL